MLWPRVGAVNTAEWKQDRAAASAARAARDSRSHRPKGAPLRIRVAARCRGNVRAARARRGRPTIRAMRLDDAVSLWDVHYILK
jgi:hypothetical protein